MYPNFTALSTLLQRKQQPASLFRPQVKVTTGKSTEIKFARGACSLRSAILSGPILWAHLRPNRPCGACVSGTVT